MIDEASESIHVQTYIFDEDSTGISLADALIRAAERGVKVYVLVDGYGSQGLPDTFIKKLTDAGIYFSKFQPLYKSRRFYLGRRLHHKIVVIDSNRCTVSGLNISDRYNDTPEASAWLDWVLYVEGQVAGVLEEICVHRLRVRPKRNHAHKKLKIEDGVYPVRVRVNDRLLGKRQIYNTYLQMFRESTTELIIMSAYFLPGREFRRNIIRAVRRGVKIKVVMTGNADVFLVKYAERYIYRWLFKNKIQVYEYRKNVLHAKIAVCDDELMTVGSYNVNNLSAFASIELNLDVKHETFVKEAKERLNEIIKTDCVQITEKKFNRQFNFISRFAHRGAYEIFRFLFFLSIKQRGDHW
jgi:cardiolipin synthase A/B